MAASRLIDMLADWVSQDPCIPVSNREAFRQTFRTVANGKLSELFGGEQLRLYVPIVGSQQRSARNERIAAAIDAGDAPEVIAKRESVSTRWVRKIRGRIGG